MLTRVLADALVFHSLEPILSRVYELRTLEELVALQENLQRIIEVRTRDKTPMPAAHRPDASKESDVALSRI